MGWAIAAAVLYVLGAAQMYVVADEVRNPEETDGAVALAITLLLAVGWPLMVLYGLANAMVSRARG